MYSVFLFDFDYTLGDSTDAIIESVNDALISMGYSTKSKDEICPAIGMSLPETFTFLTGNGDDQLRSQFLKLFMKKADEVMTSLTELLPDSDRVLEYLKAKGIATGIVTTKYHYRIDQILSKFNISHLVDVIVGGDDVKNNKPHPEALLTAMSILKVNPKDVLYIGDSIIDAKTAQGAGVDFVAVTTGTSTRDDFQAYPRVAVIEKLSEILNIAK